MLEQRTPIGRFIHTTWANLQVRCGKYRHSRTVEKCKCYDNIEIRMTREEFKQYCLSNESHILSLDRPSLDRINPALHYSLCNIQVIELAENIRKDKIKWRGDTCECCRCKKTKHLEEFAKDKRRPNGRSTLCKQCDNKRRRRGN